MHRFKFLLALPIVGILAACATTGANYQPVIDGPIDANYGANLAQCQNLAASQGALDSNAGGKAAAGAGVAAAGTAVLNNKGTNVRDAAVLGALAGLTASAIDQNANKGGIVKNCMRQRGYNVVG